MDCKKIGDKRLIYICDTASDGTSAGVLRPVVLSALAQRGGYRVLVVSSTVSNKSLFRAPSGVSRVGKVPLLRLEGLFVAGNGPQRVLNILNFTLRATLLLWRLRNKAGINIVLTSSTGTIDSFAGYIARKLFGYKWLLEIRDIWPDAPKQLRPELRSFGFYALAAFALRTGFRNANAVLSPLKRLQLCAKEKGVTACLPFLHIPNCAYFRANNEYSNSTPLSEASLQVVTAIEQLRRNGTPIVAYFGSMNTANGIERLYDLFDRVREDQASFLFVGNGASRPALERLAREKTNVRVCAAVPQADCRRLMELVDVLAFGIPALPVYRYGLSPLKLSEYLLAGRPIFYWGAPLHTDEHPEDDLAIVSVGTSDIASAVESLMNLVQEPAELLARRGDCARNMGIRRFLYDAYEAKFCSMLDTVSS